jgi:hypothetical protein
MVLLLEHLIIKSDRTINIETKSSFDTVDIINLAYSFILTIKEITKVVICLSHQYSFYLFFLMYIEVIVIKDEDGLSPVRTTIIFYRKYPIRYTTKV